MELQETGILFSIYKGVTFVNGMNHRRNNKYRCSFIECYGMVGSGKAEMDTTKVIEKVME